MNDPAAGSPTATLLRLLLPPAMRYWPNSSFTRGAGAEPGGPVLGPSPLLASSGLYLSAIGSNDGRCVQMAGTQSAQADDLHLLGIPRSRRTVASTDPQSRPVSLGISQFIVKPRELLDSGGHQQSRAEPLPLERESGPTPPPLDTTGDFPQAHNSIVVRVRPWASKGITDLLSASGCGYLVQDEVPEPTEKQPRATLGPDQPQAEAQGGREPYSERERWLLEGEDLARYRNQPDKSLHQPRTTMHHLPSYQESASACHVLSTCYPGNVPRVESN